MSDRCPWATCLLGWLYIQAQFGCHDIPIWVEVPYNGERQRPGMAIAAECDTKLQIKQTNKQTNKQTETLVQERVVYFLENHAVKREFSEVYVYTNKDTLYIH